MSVLVVAEHDNEQLIPATLNTITAATQLDSDVHVLVAGENCGAAAEAAAKTSGATSRGTGLAGRALRSPST